MQPCLLLRSQSGFWGQTRSRRVCSLFGNFAFCSPNQTAMPWWLALAKLTVRACLLFAVCCLLFVLLG